MKKGRDWTCGECGYVNFGSRGECKDCLLERPAPSSSSSSSSTPPPVRRGPVSLDREPVRSRGRALRPGEWQCRCGFDNFASRGECFKCQAPK